MTTARHFPHVLAFTLILSAPAPAQEHQIEAVTLTGIRGMVFCEFLLVGDNAVTIYNTSANGPCDLDRFSAIDPDDLARDHGASKAQLNGPKYWAMDEQTLGLGETRAFGGIEARYAATLPLASLGSGEGADPYKPYVTRKAQRMVFKAGHPVYELIDSDGHVYVMNAYGAKAPDGNPAGLAAVMPVAEGWSFRARVPDADLVIDQQGDRESQMVGDGFHQYYSLEPTP